MRSVAAIASVMHHATQASASSAYGYRQVGDPAGHQETARATVMCPGYRCRCVLRYWRGSSPWAPRKGCDWFGSPMPRPLPDAQPGHRHGGIRPSVVQGLASYETGMACLVVADAASVRIGRLSSMPRLFAVSASTTESLPSCMIY